METLSFALILIFILWLIDKHSLWRSALKIALWLVALGMLGLAGLYSWSSYSDYKNRKQQEAQDKAAANLVLQQNEARVSDVQVCVNRMKAASSKWTDDGRSFAYAMCNGNPDTPARDVSKIPPMTIVLHDGSLMKTTLAEKSKSKHLRAKTDADLTTQEYGSLACGHVAAGETVTLLEEDNGFVKVKTANGQVGWTGEYQFWAVN